MAAPPSSVAVARVTVVRMREDMNGNDAVDASADAAVRGGDGVRAGGAAWIPMETDRAMGALAGLALGDAMGMPTQSMSPESIVRAYGVRGVRGFVDAVPGQPIAPGMPAARVTDDTEQAMLLAGELVRGGGRIDIHRYARGLIDWESRMKARGSLDLLGPSTRRALEALQRGVDPSLTGTGGTTNGGAMRAAPLGVAFAPGEALVRAAHDSCVVTHNTPQGHESTLLVAFAVSLGLADLGDGSPTHSRGPHDMLRRAIREVAELEMAGKVDLGHWSPRASVLARAHRALDMAVDTMENPDDAAFARRLRGEVGTSVEANESVPAAFAIAARFGSRPVSALRFAANLGGDTDTIAAMTGAMLGASLGMRAWPQDAVARVARVNGLDFAGTAARLLAIRKESHTRMASDDARTAEGA